MTDMWKVASILALLIVAVLAGWFLLGEEAVYEEVGGPDRTGPEEALLRPEPLAPELPPESVPVEDPEPEPLPPQDPAWVLPPLNQSDPFVREQLTAMGVPENWSAQEELVRRLSVVVENASRGEYPRRQVAYLALGAPFRVVEQDDRYYVDPANYARYDTLLAALEAVDPRQVARFLDFLMPLVDEALAELGAREDARSMLAAGLRRILDVPVLTEDPELIRPNVFFTYADPALEQLRPLQKLVLRSGPSNVLRLQGWARRLAAAMAVTPAASPP
jgi:hypothetical protein